MDDFTPIQSNLSKYIESRNKHCIHVPTSEGIVYVPIEYVSAFNKVGADTFRDLDMYILAIENNKTTLSLRKETKECLACFGFFNEELSDEIKALWLLNDYSNQESLFAGGWTVGIILQEESYKTTFYKKLSKSLIEVQKGYGASYGN